MERERPTSNPVDEKFNPLFGRNRFPVPCLQGTEYENVLEFSRVADCKLKPSVFGIFFGQSISGGNLGRNCDRLQELAAQVRRDAVRD